MEEDSIKISVDHPRLTLSTDWVKKLITQVMDGERRVIRRIEIVLTGADRIQELNQVWRGADYDTDVLSFLLSQTSEVDGVVYVNLDFAEQHCQAYEATFLQEASRYIIHGLLHLLGYEDNTSEARQLMRQKEDQYLQARVISDI